jgi:single-strand DNA-binding protein
MIDLNKVYLMGNAIRDLELRYTSQGTAWGNTGLAITRFARNPDAEDEGVEKVDFVDVKFWGPIAESSESIFRKGAKVFVEGHLRGESWEDRQTGQKRSKLVVVADRVGPTD